MVDVAKKNIEDELSPNLVFILADHINFAIIREKMVWIFRYHILMN